MFRQCYTSTYTTLPLAWGEWLYLLNAHDNTRNLLMAAQNPQSLALQLTLALDRIRDSIDEDDDPQRMFDEIVNLLKTQFHADACATVLLEETSDDIEAIATVGLAQGEAIDLCREAM